METVKVSEDRQIEELLTWALADQKTINLFGRNTKKAIGYAVQADVNLTLQDLTGVTLYEPAELVMRARAGSSLVDIQKTLDDAGQMLAFSPPDYGPLLGEEAGQSTLGGVFACNLAGSDRIKAGAARDHLLGVEGFTGRGEPFHTGSRVMKNVTGYDLCKLIAGSYGTLAIATEFTFKVLPKPEKVRTVLVYGEALEGAVKTMNAAVSSVHEVSAATYLPSDVAARVDIDLVRDPGTSVTAIKVEGPAPSAEFRCNALREMFKGSGEIEELHGHRSEKFWEAVRNVKPFAEDQSRIIWKVSVPPSEAAGYLADVKTDFPHVEYFCDWAGGLIWLSLPSDTIRGGEARVRSGLGGGHATLIRGSDELKSDISPFQPLNSIKARISESIREGFDPEGILNPGRMYSKVDGKE
ncbi:MAG: FAD-binding protein [Sneathiella sp.]|nr:FAD-binding protein [Sneathiella sp.]